jgi:hypothetical protein
VHVSELVTEHFLCALVIRLQRGCDPLEHELPALRLDGHAAQHLGESVVVLPQTIAQE